MSTLPAPSGGEAATDNRFRVVRDTREKPGHGFRFLGTVYCSGMTVATLQTGDYSIQGLEDVVCIERKESINEFANNLGEARFDRELDRMATFKIAVVILQFTFEDLMAWPKSSGLHPKRRAIIKTTGPYLLKRLAALMAQHPNVQFVFAGHQGQEMALAILKQAWASYGHLKKPDAVPNPPRSEAAKPPAKPKPKPKPKSKTRAKP